VIVIEIFDELSKLMKYLIFIKLKALIIAYWKSYFDFGGEYSKNV
jgi:phosphate starvation-inducible membrane PsiE